jgi:hypothetical protein
MNPKARAVVFLLVILGLAVSVVPSNLPSHNTLTALLDGSQPPVPPKLAMLDGSQPPVPPKFAFLDGSQPPFPPKMTPVALILDGSQPPVPPKALAAAV